ncbi:MAG TPA: ATP synthase F1 subunit delta [Symbiobacteriaceae bacterium]|nr:ATP synthase F1 subunit delta [Symbiobacteriaceae bacterium]
MAHQANLAVARRYAQALFELAQEKGLMDQVDAELGSVTAAIEGNALLKAAMADVLLQPAVKQNLIEKLFASQVSELVKNFLYLVVRKRREAHLAAIYQAYLDLANAARGVVEVEVRTAVALDNETATRLESNLVAKLGKQVKFKTQVAPELKGGLVVRVGDELLDGSVATRLKRLHERLISSNAE